MFRSNNKEIRVENVSLSRWTKVGPDVTKLIANHQDLSTKDVCHLAQSCRFLFHSLKPSIDQRGLMQLASHVVLEPNEIKVTAMLNAEPTLVNAVIKQVKDSAGRMHINKTIFELAYGAGDYGMCLAIKPFFIRVYGSEKVGIEEMERRRNQLLGGESTEESARKEQESKASLEMLLQPAIAAINAEQFNLGKNDDDKLILSPITLAAIETFREEFTKNQRTPTQGIHFRDNTLLEAYEAYASAAGQWNYDYKKCALFEDGVLAHLLLYMPAPDAQKFSQGLYYLENGEQDARSLILRGTNKNFYSSLRAVSVDFHLLGSCVDIIFGGDVASVRGRRAHAGGSVSKLMSNKIVKLAELMQPDYPQPKFQCVIC
jgi:hypothetical protein